MVKDTLRVCVRVSNDGVPKKVSFRRPEKHSDLYVSLITTSLVEVLENSD